MCLDLVKELGIKPLKLDKTMNKKIEVNKIFLLSFLVFNAISNWFEISLILFLTKIDNRLGFLQNLKKRNLKIKSIIIQFISLVSNVTLLFGSKETKSLIIVLICLIFFLFFISSFLEVFDSMQ